MKAGNPPGVVERWTTSHRGADRRAHLLLRDPHARQHCDLPFRRRAAVAPHRGEDEWPRASLLQLLEQQPDHQRVIGNSAAPRADRDAHAGPDRLEHARAVQLLHEGAPHIREHRPLERRLDLHHARQRDVLQERLNRRVLGIGEVRRQERRGGE
jgi:hypothetical protein